MRFGMEMGHKRTHTLFLNIVGQQGQTSRLWCTEVVTNRHNVRIGKVAGSIPDGVTGIFH